MRILGIETSCDETAIAIVSEKDGRFMIEQNLLSSQADLHAEYGGVVPEVAAREHAAHAIPLLKATGVLPDGEGIDAIAVTAGPGLVPALRIGVELGKALAWVWKKPLVAVNHLEGHIYSTWLTAETPPELPALCLLVSGGHTELILMKAAGDYELLGMTRDDAAGEAFDKVAKLLGLPYPGGPQISREAKQGDPRAIAFPRPMIDSKDQDMSFSGLKTAVRVYLSEHEVFSVSDVAASFEQAVVDVLVHKTLKALEKTKAKSVVLGGGVSANPLLRETLKQSVSSVPVHVPDLSLTGDNAAMIALSGLIRVKAGEFVDPLTLCADPNMRLA
ncbi:tRNA (adenosine(37)-N6)-threonylcarbamoyltransferase complex transferase subunit TsaD [Candidatus Uhrbacteria bacterium CG_4_9_14_3_um_filter_50_9]|uniref:tRNA N6-adenosine threonylcarbamoyltransferase n=1 Tax=Candidatus Uhrbacteria bacterium CG_4_9_14_3_um_filter_50_9 TaxID=1975035 RepID=A0A2M7XC96_9BACT|nr:MAG: tRNA (adenosine(37)-N6)-threonylcarbamoyltransferase complex transferase subunit TsaD [Candidatus Uhrbacteria bacterium CG_4_9_14_3_um_filter_50_9]